jgi:DNA-binding protein YbaB
MLEDLIVAAVNNALEKAKTRSEEETQKIMGNLLGSMNLGGLNIPGFKF